MPATFATLDAARMLIDYAETACDPATVKVLYAMAEGISIDLATNSQKPPHAPGPMKLSVVRGIV